ncbi:MAG: hypothetical protein M1833_006311 [Piccolia ochrophora]|nr:MAG: hypothetical protein M1833_006311 [Piccolia ochrophora]
MALATAASIAGASALGAYFDAKFFLLNDLRLLYHFYTGAKLLKEAGTARTKRESLWYLFESRVQEHASVECLWSRTGSYTWQEVYDESCRYAQWFLSRDVRPGQVVAVYLQNSPEFLFVWIGLWAIGCAPALINYNLRGDALLHCLRVSKAPLLLVDEELQNRIVDVKDDVEQELKMTVIVIDEHWRATVNALETERPADSFREGIKWSDPMSLFYTSGTTGMPKAIPFPLVRGFLGGTLPAKVWERTPDDRLYNCMPLYHGTGGIATLSNLLSGRTTCIGKKFSVSRFWDDLRDSKATWFSYVGETVRYLLAAPPSPRDKDHRVRCIFGNGLRPDIWDQVHDRFGIPEIIEFYNSSEGMFGLTNYNKGPYTAHAVGHHGLLFRFINRNTFVPVAVDTSTNDLLRHPRTGFVVRQTYADGGEILVRISDPSEFPGYLYDSVSTSKKFARDVFCKGDLYYRTGDALRRTPDGRWFFLDRLGDTFRWKSENVATTEVAEVLGRFPGVREANVYGIDVPGYDGRAGCTALSLDLSEHSAGAKFDWRGLAGHARANLPSFAVPLFIRVVSTPSHIHNMKQNKVPLRAEGADPAKVSSGDRMLWLPPGGDGYVPLEEEDWKGIIEGKARL